MTPAIRVRRRPKETVSEARRLSRALGLSLGQAVKSARLGRRMTQAQLAARVGVHQAWISRIETGHGRGVPLELWVALGLVLGRPLAISFSKPLGEARGPTDAGHLAMQEHLLRLAGETGRRATFEVPTRSSDPTLSIDVCVRDARHRALVIEEAWNSFGDLGAAIRSTNRKTAEAADLAATIDDGPPYRVATVWIVRASAANRELVNRYPQIFRTAFPGSSQRWVRALTTSDPPLIHPGIAWFDPGTMRLIAARLPLNGRAGHSRPRGWNPPSTLG